MTPPKRLLLRLATVALMVGGFIGVRSALTPVEVPARARAAGGGAASVPAPPRALAGAVESRRALLAFTSAPANAAEIEQMLPAPTDRMHYVTLNHALIAGKGSPFWQTGGRGRFEVALPDGDTVAVVVDRSEAGGVKKFTSMGHLEGQPGSRAIFAYNQGVLQAMIEDSHLNRYTLRHVAGGAVQFFKVNPDLLGPCGGSPKAVADGDALTALAQAKSSATHAVAGASAGAEGEGPVIGAYAGAAGVQVSVLMAYSSAARIAGGGTASAEATMALGVTIMNSDLEHSGVAARVRLAGTAEVIYPNDELTSGTSGWLTSALTALRRTTDGKMDELHARRAELGADLVCVALRRTDTSGTIGIAYILDTPNDSLNRIFGFSAVNYTSIASGRVVSHELGHNLGCAHARGDSGTTGANDGAYSYSYGYRFIGNSGSQYRTIMAYAPGLARGYYSNPDIVAPEPELGVPVGVPIGQPGEANNALTIDRNAFEVSTYETDPVPSYAGTLVNVSTRAFTGTGEQQLIGGFVVSGAQPKKVLLRAVGPTLAGYGVGDALADPQLTVFRLHTDGTPNTNVATNDNWGDAGGAAEVTAVGSQVGAFALGAGSRDAALVVTLPPAAYTVNVEGVGGATGTTLVEAYDAEIGGPRVVNLSTRAYADSGRPMIGGFVVKGEAGVPKRILVRVLGPTLGNYGVSRTLDDPIMSLYDGQNNLLVQVDDWDPPTMTISGESVSTRGTVDLSNELKIQATGYAPGAPVEPAVLLDLLPGAYTVVVEPFELLPDQPARPGVGLVEVYEIRPP